jgi:hypothetical protein
LDYRACDFNVLLVTAASLKKRQKRTADQSGILGVSIIAAHPRTTHPTINSITGFIEDYNLLAETTGLSDE